MKNFAKLLFCFSIITLSVLLVGCKRQVNEVDSIAFVTQPKSIYKLNEEINIEIEVSVNGSKTNFVISFKPSEGVKVTNKATNTVIDLSKSGFTITGLSTTELGSKSAIIRYAVEGSSASIVFNYEVTQELEEPMFAGGSGTQNDPFLIANRQHLENIGKLFNDNVFRYYKVVDGLKRIDMSNWKAVNLYGSFDGNGVHFDNLDDELFDTIGGERNNKVPDNPIVIQNFSITANISNSGSTGVIAYWARAVNVTFKNITVKGQISGSYHLGLIAYGAGTGTSFLESHYVFEKVVNEATIIQLSNDAPAAFIGHPLATSSSTVVLKDSLYIGELYYVGSAPHYVVGHASGSGPITISYSEDFIENSSTKYNLDITTIYTQSESDKRYTYYVLSNKQHKLTVENGDLPEKGAPFTVKLEPNVTKVVFALSIGPNAKPDKDHDKDWGNFVGVFEEDVYDDLTGEQTTITSDKVRYYTVRVNPQGINSTGPSADKKFYYIVNSKLGKTIGSNTTVNCIQYDSSGFIVKIIKWNFNDMAEVNSAQ